MKAKLTKEAIRHYKKYPMENSLHWLGYPADYSVLNLTEEEMTLKHDISGVEYYHIPHAQVIMWEDEVL